MGTAGAGAVLIRREKDLVEHFRRRGAMSSTTALSPVALGVHTRFAWELLLRGAVIREGAAPGTYYLDELSWTALRSRRRRVALIVLVGVLIMALVPIVASWWTTTAHK